MFSLLEKFPSCGLMWFLQVNHHPPGFYGADFKNVRSLHVLNVPIRMCGKSPSFDYGGGVRLCLLKLQPVMGPFSITADGRWMDMQQGWDGNWGER